MKDMHSKSHKTPFDMPNMPLDGRLMLRNRKMMDGQGEDSLLKLLAVEDIQCSLSLLGPSALLSLLVGFFSYFVIGQMQGQWLLFVGLAAVSLLLLLLYSQRAVVARSHLLHWRILLLITLSTQSAVWAIALAQGLHSMHVLSITLCVGGLVLSLIPLIYWLPGYLLVLFSGLFVALWQAFSSIEMILAVSIHVPLLLLGLSMLLFARRLRQSEFKMRKITEDLALSKSQFSDQKARLSYEREQRQNVEQDLIAVRELADSAGRAKTEFLATISHEIRTPLNGILPILEMLRASPLNDEQKRYVRTASSSSHHLLRIINDILDFAKTESGKLQFESIEIDLRELVDSVVDLMRGSAQNRGLSLQVTVAENVPSSVRGDPIRIRQILTNLISNAIKFTETGGVQVTLIKSRSSRKEVELMFEVSDTGKGMSREVSRHLFQSFTQADASTTRKYGGTGLGLVICKRLVTLMGGKIGVRSRVGEGSTFWFMLPMRKSVLEVPSTRKSLSGVRILTAIKDVQTADYVSQLLIEWGVLEERVNSLEKTVNMLRTSATLGKSWLYDLFLIDAWGSERQVPMVLRELRSHAELKKLNIVVASRSEEMSEELKRDFSVYTITGILKSGPLRRCLDRLLDVEDGLHQNGNGNSSPEYRDLNVDNELALDDDIVESGIEQSIDDLHFSGRVLLVEDNPVNLGVVKKILTRMGVKCLEAHNGDEALDILRKDPVDLIFMDCQMPVMDGYQATESWREIERREQRQPIPIVAMTANAMQGDREKCLHVGMNDYLAKPVSIKDIEGTLRQWLNSEEGIRKIDQDTQVVKSSEVTDAVLDDAIIKELREVMEEDFPSLVRTYMSNSPKLLGLLENAVDQRDMLAIALHSHSLKSSSANLGAMQVSGIARRIELAARDDRLQDVLVNYKLLAAAYAAAKNALDGYV